MFSKEKTFLFVRKKTAGPITILYLIAFFLWGCLSSQKTTAETPQKISKNHYTESKCLQKNWDELKKRRLRLLPVPKRLTFTGRTIDLPGNLAIVLENKTKQGIIAAKEISSRIKDLSGKEVPMLDAPRKGAFNIILENTYSSNTFAAKKSLIKTKNPFSFKQSYVLEPDEHSIRLAGASPIGLIYAAVTLRYLIEEKDGKTLLYPAAVADWPDWPRRHLARLIAPYHSRFLNNPQKHLKYMKKFADWLLRLKINGVCGQSFMPFYKKHSPFFKGKLAKENYLKSAELLGNYLRERGISIFNITTETLAYDGNQYGGNMPEVKKMMHNPIHHAYFSWGRDDLHMAKAEKMANVFEKMRTDTAMVHCVDGGGFQDPTYWSLRDELTKSKYKNDRAKANIDVFNIYISAFKKHGINTVLTIYPYHGKYLTEGFGLQALGMQDNKENRKTIGKQTEKLKNFLKSLNAGLDKDIALDLREGDSKDIALFLEQIPGRPFDYAFFPAELKRDTMQLLPPELNTWKTAFYSQRTTNDIARLAIRRKLMEQASVCAAEYTWNTEFPGAQQLDRTRNPINYDPRILDIMAERAAVGLWGYEAGIDLKNVFNSQLSYYWAYDPAAASKLLELKEKDKIKILKMNWQAALKANHAMDKVWLEIKKRKTENKKNIIDNFSYPIFITNYKLVKAAVPYTAARYYKSMAKEYAKNAKMEEADKAISKGLTAINEGALQYSKTLSEIKNEPELTNYDEMSGWWRSAPNMDANLLNPDFDGLRKELMLLKKEKNVIFLKYNIPEWYEKFMSERDVYAIRTKEKINVDGKIAEKSWMEAPPIECFIGNKVPTPPQNPVEIRMLYDNKCIYVAGKIHQPNLGYVKKQTHPSDKYVRSEDVELFFRPLNGKEYTQIVLDSLGNIFTLRKTGTGLQAKKEKGLDLGIKKKIKKGIKQWSFELAIPFSGLKAEPDKNWKLLIAYNGLEKVHPQKEYISYSNANTHKKSFHDPEIYQKLKFKKKQDAPLAEVAISILNPETEGKTYAEGSGTLVSFGLKLETKRPLHDLEVIAEFMDANNKKIAPEKLLLKKSYLPLFWRTSKALNEQLSIFHKTINLKIIATYKLSDGKIYKTTKEIILGPHQKKNSGKTTKQTFIDASKGNLSFKMKPNWNGIEKGASDNAYRAILHAGPINSKCPEAINRNSFTLYKKRTKGFLNFKIANDRYRSRFCGAGIKNWKKGEWHKIKLEWDMRTNPVTMKIYIDGKLASGKVRGSHGKTDEPLSIIKISYPLKFGSLCSNAWFADAEFSEFHSK